MHFLRLKETRPVASLVALAAWICAALLAANMVHTLPGSMPLLVMPLINSVSVLAMLMSALLAYIAVRSGRVPAILCALSSVAVCALTVGGYAALALGLIQLPAAVFAVYCYERKRPFWPSVGICVGMELAAGMIVLAMANALNGGDAVTALRDMLEPLVRVAPETDRTLLWLASMGVVRLPDVALPGIQLGSTVVLAEPVREELIKQFQFAMESLLRQSLPIRILEGAIWGGLLCVAWPRRIAARYATEMEIAPLPPFHDWHIPSRLFRPMIISLIAVWLLVFVSGEQAIASVADVLWAGVSTVVALQGGALLSSLMRKSGVRARNRVVIVIALLLLLNFSLVLLGFADQMFNPRMLRKPSHDKRDEEEDR